MNLSQLSLTPEENTMPKDVNDMRFHRLTNDEQYTNLQVILLFDTKLTL